MTSVCLLLYILLIPHADCATSPATHAPEAGLRAATMPKDSQRKISWWTRLVRRILRTGVSKRLAEVNYHQLQQNIGYQFHNLRLLRQALIHRSFANESGDPRIEDNEKFEFLGDSVLGFVMSDFLYHAFPNFREGDMSRVKSHVVSEAFLAKLAREIELGSFMLFGKGEASSGGHKKDSLLSDCYEALIASIYLDGGIEPAREFLMRAYKERVETIVYDRHILDHKSLLQEHAQELFRCMPRYRLHRAIGPDHERIYEMDLYIDGEVFSVGTGRNKKEAEQNAAKAALGKLNINEGKSKA